MPETAMEHFNGDHVFIGRRMAEALNIDVGDKITLLTQQGTATAFGTMPRQKTFLVAGIFYVGMGQFDKNFVFMPLATAQIFFKAPGKISQIDVFSSHDDLASNLANTLQQALGDRVRALDWRHSDISIMHAVKMERNVMFLILTLIILIASFNIISGLIMMVKDKTRDIAILRTMGATKQTILKIFFLTGASIGGVGTILGVGLGLSFALNIEVIRQFLQSLTGAELFSEEIYFLSTLPSKVEFDEVLRIVAMGIGLSFLATLYPSWRASSLDPVEGLRG
jgi:lipoprotein-releasing system permease protein